MLDPEPLLSYPLQALRSGDRGQSQEYVIPAADKASVLDQLYPFEDVPALDDERLDIHVGKRFFVRDFKVVREEGMNYLVSPYYHEGGGTVIDWFPVDVEDEV